MGLERRGERKGCPMNAKGLILAGLGMAALGGLLSLASQSTASENGGTYYVFTGLLVVGGINVVRGLYFLAKEKTGPRYTERRVTTSAVQRTTRPSPSFRTSVPLDTHQASRSSEPSTRTGRPEASQLDGPVARPSEAGDHNSASRDAPVNNGWVAGPEDPRRESGTPSQAFRSARQAVSPSPAPQVGPGSKAEGGSSLPVSSVPTAESSADESPRSSPAALVADHPEQPPPPPPVPAPERQPMAATTPSATSTIPPRSKKTKRRGVKLVLAGIAAILLVSLGVAGALLFQTGSPSGPSRESAIGSTKEATRPTRAPKGFTASRGAAGWTTYTSATKGFSIALPAGWAPLLHGSPGKRALFNAFDRDPSYDVSRTVSTTQLLIVRFKYLDVVSPRKYVQTFRRSYSRDPRVAGLVELYRLRMPAGNAAVFRFVRSASPDRSYTIFMVLHEHTWYQLVFGVPARHASRYLPIFTSISQSLRFP